LSYRQRSYLGLVAAFVSDLSLIGSEHLGRYMA
jgi:hypothetical protein